MAVDLLIVEDNKDLRDLYSKKLKELDINILVAEDGEEALNLLKNNKPNLILLDIVMPNTDGLEVLRALHLDNAYQPEIIILSNLSDPNLIKTANDLGAKHYLVKANIDPKDIVELVERYI